jgi:polysaccharide transporter, PST family
LYLNKILKNILSLTIGNFLNLLLNFFSIVLAARYLDVNLFGDFSFLIAVVGILSKFIDGGVNQIVFRETSRTPRNFIFINNSLVIKFFIFISVLIAFNAAALMLNFESQIVILTNVLLSGIIFSSKYQNFRDVLEIPYKVDLKMHYPMILNLIDNFLLLVMVLLMPLFNGGLLYFVLAYTFTNLPGFLILFYVLKKKYSYSFRLELKGTREVFIQALPLFGYSLLKYFKDSYSAGIFSGAARIAFPLYIFPTALISTIFPSISRNMGINEEQNSAVMNMGIKTVILFAVFVALIITFKSKEIITIIFGSSYEASHQPLVFLLWAQVFIFINFMINDYFTAYKWQKWNFIYAVVIVIINFTITILLIRDYSFLAPSIAKIFSGFTGLLLMTIIVKKVGLKIHVDLRKIFLWFLVSAVSLYVLSLNNIIVYLLVSPVVFAVITLIIRFFSKEELRNLLSLFRININLSNRWLSSL